MSRDSEAPRDEPQPLTVGNVHFYESLPSLEDCFARVGRMAEAYAGARSADLRDVRTADVVALAGDLHLRASVLEREYRKLASHVLRLEAEKRALESRCADREADKKALVEGDVWRASNGWVADTGVAELHPDADSALRAFHASQSRTSEARDDG